MKTALLFALIAAVHLQTGDAVKCYVCTSATDSNCADPLTDDHRSKLNPQECTSEVLNKASGYMKSFSKSLSDIGSTFGLDIKVPVIDSELVCNKVQQETDGKMITVRGCSLALTEKVDPCKEAMKQSSKITFCEMCKSDLCNSAPALQSVALFLVPAVALLLAHL